MHKAAAISRSMDGLAVMAMWLGECAGVCCAPQTIALRPGVRADQLIWDPGLGFAKKHRAEPGPAAGCGAAPPKGSPLLLGPSRKRFIGAVVNEPRPRAGCGATAWRLRPGRSRWAPDVLLRVHDVGPIVCSTAG